MIEARDEEPCPECGHPIGEHDEDGCCGSGEDCVCSGAHTLTR